MTTITPIQRDRGNVAVDQVDDLCGVLLASLPRTDQRRRGNDYVRGLLAAEGRKSICNIAAHVGGRATAQKLHHFISDSTWDWRSVRRALADHVAKATGPSAWVVRYTVIPKTGDQAVGVSRRYHSCLDQTLNAQVAAGLWSATYRFCAPTNWRLHLPAADRASSAQVAEPESLEECAIRSFTEMLFELPRRPVVVDSRDLDTATLVDELTPARFPALLRIDDELGLLPDDAAYTGQPTVPRPAGTILNAVRHLRSPVVGPGGSSHSVATVGVALPSRGGARAAKPTRPLRLVGTGRHGERWPSQLWLTTLRTARRADLAYLTTLPEAVEHEMSDVAEGVGIRDFSGRSLAGWHRHMTLASIAHTLRAMDRPTVAGVEQAR